MTKPDMQQSQTTGESVPSRTMAPLSSPLEKHLKTYAITAAAAGVGLLSPALPADAQVVYTPAHIKITDGDLFLDFNCGPRVNFWIADNIEFSNYGAAVRELALNGGINASVIEDSHGPTALPPGSVVGSSRAFTNVHQNERIMAEAYRLVYYSTGVSGNWANVKQAYLGLKFDIQGQIHYGWAEFSVNASVQHGQVLVDAALLGYAYEATPNQSIKTGQKSGMGGNASTPGVPAPQPSTLQALARGAASQGGCPDYEPHGAARHRRPKTP
jgi:hypothetical protein